MLPGHPSQVFNKCSSEKPLLPQVEASAAAQIAQQAAALELELQAALKLALVVLEPKLRGPTWTIIQNLCLKLFERV